MGPFIAKAAIERRPPPNTKNPYLIYIWNSSRSEGRTQRQCNFRIKIHWCDQRIRSTAITSYETSNRIWPAKT